MKPHNISKKRGHIIISYACLSSGMHDQNKKNDSN